MFKSILTRKNMIIVIIIVFLSLLFFIAVLKIQTDDSFEIYFLDVGQGDSILVRNSGFDLLIDGGPGTEINYYLSKFFYPLCEVDSILLTHPHADHMDGLEMVLDRCLVDFVFKTDLNITKQNYERWLSRLEHVSVVNNSGPTPQVVNLAENSEIKAGELRIIVIWPPQEEIEVSKLDLNNLSLGLFIDYKDFEALLLSDIEKDAQSQINTSSFMPLVQGKVDVLKFPHQGSKDALNKEFFEKINPKYVILSVGKNSYGHPSKETMEYLQTQDVIIYRTDREGTIKFKYVK